MGSGARGQKGAGSLPPSLAISACGGLFSPRGAYGLPPRSLRDLRSSRHDVTGAKLSKPPSLTPLVFAAIASSELVPRDTVGSLGILQYARRENRRSSVARIAVFAPRLPPFFCRENRRSRGATFAVLLSRESPFSRRDSRRSSVARIARAPPRTPAVLLSRESPFSRRDFRRSSIARIARAPPRTPANIDKPSREWDNHRHEAKINNAFWRMGTRQPWR